MDYTLVCGICLHDAKSRRVGLLAMACSAQERRPSTQNTDGGRLCYEGRKVRMIEKQPPRVMKDRSGK